MDVYEVDTDRWRDHARRVEAHGQDVAGIAGSARAMAADPLAYGVVLAPLGVRMSLVQGAAAGAIDGLSGVLAVAADAVRAGAAVSDAVDDLVAATFRKALR